MNKSTGTLILTTAYFPPVVYFREIADHMDTQIEIHENYIKQSYRNRCYILGANGKLSLSVPVKEGSLHKVPIEDIEIDNSRKWQVNHLRSIEAAYSSSAYWEFVMDEINLFFTRRFDNLLEMNFEILKRLLTYLEIDVNPVVTTDFKSRYDSHVNDLRYILHPKKTPITHTYNFPPYFQVFGIGTSFVPNLSIIDLLFNMGPEAYSYLKSIKKETSG